MSETNLASAEAYYKAMNNKDLSGVAQCLHPDVQFIGPLAETKGKEALLEAVKGFMPLFNSLTVHAKFSSGNQVMLSYYVDFPAPIGIFRAAALMTFENGLISCLELFYDARPFEEKKHEIFSQQ